MFSRDDAAPAGVPDFLTGSGEMGALMRAQDWSATPLGPPSTWPQALRSALSTCLNSRAVSAIYWGPEFRLFYNDGYRPFLDQRHPWALGKPMSEIWPMMWQALSAPAQAVLETGEGVIAENQPLMMERDGGLMESFWYYSFAPIRGETGRVDGIFLTALDTTERVFAERRQAFRLALEARLREVENPVEVVAAASEALGRQLEVTQVAYAEVEPEGESVLIEREWNNGSMASNAGRHRLDDYGPAFVADLKRGWTVAIPDVRLDPRTSSTEALAAFARTPIRAFLNVPVIKAGRLVAILGVHSEIPRAWSSEEVALAEEIANRIWSAAQRARNETGLRESEARLGFLDRLGAATEPLADADAVLATTTRLLGEHLNLSVCAYADMDEDQDGFTIRGDWSAPGSTSILGHYSLADFGKLAVKNLSAGLPLIVRDNLRELAPEEAATFQSIGIAATICMPLVKNGRLTALMAIHDRVPRRWTEAELGLLRDVTARSWAHVERVAATAELRESESRFRNMADRAPVMMWVTDPSGYCTHLNARWYEYTGQEPGAGEGYGWLDAVHPDDRPTAEQAFISANAERRDYRVDFRLRRAEGAYRWMIDAAAARFNQLGEYLGYVGSVIDIDERREAEEKLALSEERLRLATEVAEVGQWDVDNVTETMFWPPRVKAMFGISPDVPVTLADFHSGVHPDDREKTRAAYEATCNPDLRTLYDVEYRTIGKEDGLVRWVAAKGRGLFTADGVCFRVIGTAIDVTARKADEVRLRELNERLEQEVTERTAERNRVWEMSRDLFAIMGFDGHLKAINPAWETTLGRDTETLLSLSFREQVHPDDHQSVQAIMERLLRGETVERFEDRLRHADGSWRWISWTLVPEGDVFYAVGRDVTREKEATAELEQAQEALRQSQKMEAMGQLTGGVAHDFNNLLTPIVGSLDMLQRKGLGGEREQRLIAGAMQSADRAKTLVQRLLAFARRQPLQASAVDVGGLVTGMADLVASTSGPQIKVVVETAEMPPAKADSNQLEMALLNLGVNARDAMPDGGTLRITAGSECVTAGHRSNLRPGEYVRLSVADTGVGMDEATLKRAVEPFFSTKGIGKGTGLGLSMVHGLASQLGGSLTIESRPGVGTNVELWLPVSNAPAELEKSPVVAASMPATRGTALLVDDEELVRMSTADMLGDMGYSVVEAGSAEEALRLLDGGLRPDLLVTDHLMPGMNGADLANVVRSDRPAIQVLIVSGYAESDGIDADLPRLTKPFRNAELATKLSELASGA